MTAFNGVPTSRGRCRPGARPTIALLLLFAAVASAAPRIAAVQNAASYAPPPVAPGEIIVIWGDGMGPDAHVLFDGVAATIIYATATQTSAVVPLPVDGKSSTALQVEYQGQLSDPFPLPVASTAPGIFTLDMTGKGQSAALLDDYSINTPENPFRPGSVVQLYVTGLGVTGGDAPLRNVPTATIGGAAAVVEWAGPAPGLPLGAYQVNVRMPAAAGRGQVPIVLESAGSQSQTFALVSVELGQDPPDLLSVLDNGAIRIGANLDLGGVISYLSASGGTENVINSHDYGRQVQQSYYAGPQPYGTSSPSWPNWPWNPIGTGDAYHNKAAVAAYLNDGQTLYVREIPMQWALNNVPCECTFESWIRLDGQAAVVHAKLRNARTDGRVQWAGRNQELPAVYVNGKYYRLFTYSGDQPFQGDALNSIQNVPPPWTSWNATENWAAYINDQDFGLGVFHPGVYHFSGGFAGTQNVGGPADNPTGYISPNLVEMLDYNIVYDYDYSLILGSLAQIRDYVYRHQPDPLPEYVFDNSRAHWTYSAGAYDAGFPIQGYLRIYLDGFDPYLMGPDTWFRAQDVPKLYIRAAYRGKANTAQVFWQTAGQPGFSAGQSTSFQTVADGQYHTYEVDLSAAPGYQGWITRLRFDPSPGNGPGDSVDLSYISYRRRENQ